MTNLTKAKSKANQLLRNLNLSSPNQNSKLILELRKTNLLKRLKKK
jgi:hypothetical protein